MASDGGVEVRRPRRWARITGIVVTGALLAGITTWQIAARSSDVVPGSLASSGAGATLPDCVPDFGDSIWAMFGKDEHVAVVQTVRNDAQWPVTLISTDPDAYRFEPMADDGNDDLVYVSDPVDGPPDAAATSDRVTIPPAREATLWIIDPQGDTVGFDDGWRTFGHAPLRLRAFGVERDFRLPFRGSIAVGGAEATTGRLDRALQEACEA